MCRASGPSRRRWADYQSINELVGEGGRLRRQRDLAYELITAIPGVTCVKPSAALYMFPQARPRRVPDCG